jgi:hypothetical protein
MDCSNGFIALTVIIISQNGRVILVLVDFDEIHH